MNKSKLPSQELRDWIMENKNNPAFYNVMNTITIEIYERILNAEKELCEVSFHAGRSTMLNENTVSITGKDYYNGLRRETMKAGGRNVYVQNFVNQAKLFQNDVIGYVLHTERGNKYYASFEAVVADQSIPDGSMVSQFVIRWPEQTAEVLKSVYEMWCKDQNFLKMKFEHIEAKMPEGKYRDIPLVWSVHEWKWFFIEILKDKLD